MNTRTWTGPWVSELGLIACGNHHANSPSPQDLWEPLPPGLVTTWIVDMREYLLDEYNKDDAMGLDPKDWAEFMGAVTCDACGVRV